MLRDWPLELPLRLFTPRFLGQGTHQFVSGTPCRSPEEVRWGVHPIPPASSGFEPSVGGFSILFVCLFLLCLVPLSLALRTAGGPRALIIIVLCLGVTGGSSAHGSEDPPASSSSQKSAQKTDAKGHRFGAWDAHTSCPSCRYSEGHRCSIDKPCEVSKSWTEDLWAKLLSRRSYKQKKAVAEFHIGARSGVSGHSCSRSRTSHTSAPLPSTSAGRSSSSSAHIRAKFSRERWEQTGPRAPDTLPGHCVREVSVSPDIVSGKVSGASVNTKAPDTFPDTMSG